MLKIVLFFVGIFCSVAVFGQIQPDTASVPEEDRGPSSISDTLRIYSPLTVKTISEADMDTDSLVTSTIDTSITGFQNYSHFYKNNNYYVNNGSTGLAARTLLFSPETEIGFRTGQTAFSLYEYNKQKLRYYRTRSPYTQLNYVSGGKQEQLFSFIHSQNLTPRLNAGVEYKAIGSDGYYPNQKVRHMNLAAFAWYQSSNLRYNLLANIIYNDLRTPENGGLVNENIFDVVGNQDQILQQQTFLDDALNRWRGTAIYLKQYYNIGKINSIDTGKNFAEKVYPSQRISHSVYFEQKSFIYDDNTRDPSYYYFIFNNEPLFTDSIHYRNLENEVTLSVFGRTGKKQKAFSKAAILEAGLKHRLINYSQGTIDTNFNVLSLRGKAGYQFSERLNILFNGERVFLGPYDGDLSLSADANIFINSNIGSIKLGALYQRKSPAFIFENNASGYWRWQNNFEKTNLSRLSFAYRNEKFKFGISGKYALLSNYTFFRGRDKYVTPYQYTSDMDVLQLSLDKDFHFSNFVFSAHVLWQKTNYRNILLTPEVYAYGSLYYQNKLFKVLDFQVGLDVRYFTEVKAYSYRPELGQFYIDENARTIGDYPIVDAFVSARLRRTRLFLKFDHVNQGFPERGYYTVKRYPMPNRSLKFGVSWRFYD